MSSSCHETNEQGNWSFTTSCQAGGKRDRKLAEVLEGYASTVIDVDFVLDLSSAATAETS
jgi:hypothetical protein